MPGGSEVKNCTVQETQIWSWVELIPGKENGYRLSIIAWGTPWTESLASYTAWGHKASNTTEQLTISFILQEDKAPLVCESTKNSEGLNKTIILFTKQTFSSLLMKDLWEFEVRASELFGGGNNQHFFFKCLAFCITLWDIPIPIHWFQRLEPWQGHFRGLRKTVPHSTEMVGTCF